MNKVECEPAAWIVRHPHFCGKFTDDKEIAEYWENKEQGCTTPLVHHSQAAPAIVSKMVEALVMARGAIAAALRANAPDWFGTDEDIARHVSIKQIDAAIAASQSAEQQIAVWSRDPKRQSVLNLSEAARCLGVAQEKGDQGAIEYWGAMVTRFEREVIQPAYQQPAPDAALIEGGLDEDSKNGIHQAAFEFGGTDEGNYILTPEELDAIINATVSACHKQIGDL